jgi:hypothetical protein
MRDDEFIALDPGLLSHPSKTISRRHAQAAPGADASAFQGRLSAQVALLQSLILPAAHPAYPQQTKSGNIPVDDTHTCIRRAYGVGTAFDASARPGGIYRNHSPIPLQCSQTIYIESESSLQYCNSSFYFSRVAGSFLSTS